MKILIELLACIMLVPGCSRPEDKVPAETKVQTMEIVWQRLVDESGETCVRCGTTEASVDEAARKLYRSLRSLGINVVLKKKTLSPSAFEKEPLESNRIWIAGVPIEQWLSATTGQSQCSSACGSADCRTVTIDGNTYEAISADMIIKAGLLASAQLFHVEPGGSCSTSPDSTQQKSGCCP